MEYVNFGASGLKVSRIAFGLGFRSQSDEREMQKLIERAFDLGVTLFDCANIYGPMDDRRYTGVSEQVLGRALASRRDDVVITSKVASAVGDGPNDSGNSRYHIMREVERSLTRLNTDHIDIYILHVRDETTPFAEAVATMDDLVRQGKIRYWGVSNFAAWELCKILWTADRLGAAKPSCIQNPYSLLHRELEKEVMPLCKEEGVAIEAYSPLAVGLLSGRYFEGQTTPRRDILGRPKERRIRRRDHRPRDECHRRGRPHRRPLRQTCHAGGDQLGSVPSRGDGRRNRPQPDGVSGRQSGRDRLEARRNRPREAGQRIGVSDAGHYVIRGVRRSAR